MLLMSRKIVHVRTGTLQTCKQGSKGQDAQQKVLVRADTLTEGSRKVEYLSPSPATSSVSAL